MVYKQNYLYYRAASTNFEELHSVTVPATAKPAVIAANYADNPNYRLVNFTTPAGMVIHSFLVTGAKAGAGKVTAKRRWQKSAPFRTFEKTQYPA